MMENVRREPSEVKSKHLNPGIRKLVNFLQQEKFHTIDSGDGETHDYKCDRDYGYISIMSSSEKLIEESERLVKVLRRVGIEAVPARINAPEPGHCNIQASYCPIDGFAIIDVRYVHDKYMKKEK